MEIFGITQIMRSFVELFGIIYTTGFLVFTWLSTPLSETAGSVGDILGEFGDFTPFEIMFGAGLIFTLIFALARFILGKQRG